MAKMNLNFLLSPDSNSSRAGMNQAPHSSRNDSPFSLDYIAPRSNNSDHHRHHHRRSQDPSNHSRSSSGTSSKNHAHRDQGSLPSRTSFKSKKGKAPTSPSAPRPSSSAEVKPHVCPQCERSFYKLEQLKRHDRLVHQNLRPFVCHTCDLSFGTKQNMQVHLTTRKHRHRLQTLQSSMHSIHPGSSRHHH